MKNPLVSVVLGSYNRRQFIELTIDSIRQDLISMPHEIIVVDGGSTDGTLQWLLEQKDIITIVQHNRGTWQGKKIERRSWGYFMNLGFKCAQGKYVCMLSDDCVVIPGAIVNGYHHAEAEIAKGRNIGAVAFYFRDWSKESLFSVCLTLSNKMYVNHGLYLNHVLKEVNYADEETYFFYNGDGDLCLKIWHQGYEVIDSPNSYIEHYPHANLTVRSTNYQQFEQDKKGYFKKWKNIFYDPSKHIIGGVITKEFNDPTNTAARFARFHADTLNQHPTLLLPPTTWQMFRKRLKWKWESAHRKLKNVFRSS